MLQKNFLRSGLIKSMWVQSILITESNVFESPFVYSMSTGQEVRLLVQKTPMGSLMDGRIWRWIQRFDTVFRIQLLRILLKRLFKRRKLVDIHLRFYPFDSLFWFLLRIGYGFDMNQIVSFRQRIVQMAKTKSIYTGCWKPLGTGSFLIRNSCRLILHLLRTMNVHIWICCFHRFREWLLCPSLRLKRLFITNEL